MLKTTTLMVVVLSLLSGLSSTAAASPIARKAVSVPNIPPPPDAGDTYASVGGGTHVCNEHAICQGTFSGSGQLTGWVRATLHLSINLYADGKKLASSSNTCAASTSCYVAHGNITFNYVYPGQPQVCVTASGQASYSGGTAVGSDQECIYIGGSNGGTIAER